MSEDLFWNGVATFYWWTVFMPMLVLAVCLIIYAACRFWDDYRFWNRR